MLHRSNVARLSALMAVALLAGCGGGSSEPKVVRQNNPTVTYQYHSDRELIQANQNAAAYCAQYHAVPTTSRFTDTSEGRGVVFECVPSAEIRPTTTARVYVPETPYSYRSDQDLMDAARDADLYCRDHGHRGATSTVSISPDGTKSTSFRCTDS